MASIIKSNRVAKLCDLACYPNSYAAMVAAIPDAVWDALPARLIAELIEANWRLAGNSKALAAREALENGFVWDARRNCARDIAPGPRQ